jgi:hypothetical protein
VNQEAEGGRTMIFLDIAIVTAWLVVLVFVGLHLAKSD